jgi:hypothetical protein
MHNLRRKCIKLRGCDVGIRINKKKPCLTITIITTKKLISGQKDSRLK